MTLDLLKGEIPQLPSCQCNTSSEHFPHALFAFLSAINRCFLQCKFTQTQAVKPLPLISPIHSESDQIALIAQNKLPVQVSQSHKNSVSLGIFVSTMRQHCLILIQCSRRCCVHLIPIWPSISFGRRRPRGQLSADMSANRLFCSARSSSACRQ